MSSHFKVEPSRVSKLEYATSASPALVKSRTPAQKHKGKDPYMLHSEPQPAVKDLNRFRSKSDVTPKSLSWFSKPSSSKKTNSYVLTEATKSPYPPSPKVHIRGNNHTSKPSSNGLSEKTKVLCSAIGGHKQAPHGGRGDPYDIISDSEGDDHKVNAHMSTPSFNKLVSSSMDVRTGMMTPLRNPKIPPSSLGQTAMKSSPIISSPRKAHVSERPERPQRPQRRTPTPVPLKNEVIVLDSSSSEGAGTFITPKKRSNAKRRPSTGPSTPGRILENSVQVSASHSSKGKMASPSSGSSQRITKKIPAGTEVISINSSSESDREQNEKVATPVRSPSKAFEKHSRHSVANHPRIIKEAKDPMRVSAGSTRSGKKEVRGSIVPRENISNDMYKQRAFSPESKERNNKSASSSIQSLQPPFHERASTVNERHATLARHINPKEIRKSNPVTSSKCRDSSISHNDLASTSTLGRKAPHDKLRGSSGKVDTILDASLKESRYYYDRRQSTPNNEERPCKKPNSERDSPNLVKATDLSRPVRDTASSSGVMRKPRDRCDPKSTTTFNPIKPTPSAQIQGPTAISTRSSPSLKRTRTVSDATNIDSNGSQKGAIRASIENDMRKEADTITQSVEFDRKPWWNPQAWIERYETGFVIDFKVRGRLWLGIGPFKGWISDGPGKGTYMPGYEPPDDTTIAKAEKTAVLRYNLRVYEPEPEDCEQCERDNSSGTNKSDEDKGSGTQLSPGANKDTGTITSPKRPIVNQEEKKPHFKASVSYPERNALLDQMTPPDEAKAIERAERRERTEQYVLTGSNPSGGGTSPQIIDANGPINSRTRGKLPAYIISRTDPERGTSSPSMVSETTSTLIAQQLMDDCAQVVDRGLAGSRLANRHARDISSTQCDDKQTGPTEDSTGSGESSPHIPTPLPRETLLLPSGPESDEDTPSDVETTAEWIIPPNTSTETNIAVVLPFMSAEERTEYEVVSPASTSSTSLPSFEEINKATPSISFEPDESGEETLNYVLRQSPTWLHNVTEVTEPRETIRTTRPLSELRGESCLNKLPPMDNGGLRDHTKHRSHQPSSQPFPESIKGEQKRKAHPATSSPASEPPASKKQKTDDSPAAGKKRRFRPNQKQRRRMKRRREAQEQQQSSSRAASRRR